MADRPTADRCTAWGLTVVVARTVAAFGSLVLGTFGPVSAMAQEPGNAPVTAPGDSAAPPAAEPDTEAAELVERLGHVEFTVRERATQRLINLGLPAIDALRAGSEHPDREIRYRSQRILAIVRDQDFESRLQAFLADSSSTRDYDLPGWKHYRQFAGDDPQVRELFVEMQRSEPKLLAAIEEGPKATNELLTKRMQQIQESMRVNRSQIIVDVGTITTLLFASLDEEVPVSAFVGQTISNLLYQPAFNNAIHSGGERPLILRRMLAHWIRRRADPANVYQSIMLALRYEVKEGLVPAARALRISTEQMNQPSDAHLRQYGLLTVARFGGPEHIPLVEPLLEDKTPYGGQRRVNNVNYRTQIRDIALATLVQLAEQDHADYGFKHLQKHPQYVFNASTLAFADDKEREAAIEKWKAYRGAAGSRDKSADAKPVDQDDENGKTDKKEDRSQGPVNRSGADSAKK